VFFFSKFPIIVGKNMEKIVKIQEKILKEKIAKKLKEKITLNE